VNGAQQRRLDRTGGTQGNERLTSTLELALIALLVAEAATTLSLSTHLNVHIFLGLLLLAAGRSSSRAPGWRALRYYSGSGPYRLLGPLLALRLPRPLLVAATLVLFGSASPSS
jgi:hypothetical protein